MPSLGKAAAQAGQIIVSSQAGKLADRQDGQTRMLVVARDWASGLPVWSAPGAVAVSKDVVAGRISGADRIEG